MLKENTIFGIEDKVAVAIERLRHFENQACQMQETGYWVAFSGGKDSIVIYDLVKRAGVKHTVAMGLTTVDPPELLRFIKKQYPEVSLIRPKETMWQLLVRAGVPPTRIKRYCCDVLKEQHGTGHIIITGIRWEESSRRSKRRMSEVCLTRKKDTRFLHPIIDWSTTDVWDYIKKNNIPYSSLYNEGMLRIGCIGCPMSDNQEKEFGRWPKYKQAYLKAFERGLKNKRERGLESTQNTAEEMMDWWLRKKEKQNEDDYWLFE